jgi:hypothetical protein
VCDEIAYRLALAASAARSTRDATAAIQANQIVHFPPASELPPSISRILL